MVRWLSYAALMLAMEANRVRGAAAGFPRIAILP
jgi:hypothetical protein